jgi:hypothetical protein
MTTQSGITLTNSCMIAPTSPASKGAVAPANPRSGVRELNESPSHQFQQLANDIQHQVNVMEQNRARINQGWEELTRLDGLLASLEATLGDRAKELRQAKPRPLRPPETGEKIQRAA